jgi:hypothetical protein
MRCTIDQKKKEKSIVLSLKVKYLSVPTTPFREK